ncbi:MAG: hypothetical protein KDN18_13245 [Verrucomicrobiae bacterium]|nr:hypothetical protein [Verrucomicrobiae bacterium]
MSLLEKVLLVLAALIAIVGIILSHAVPQFFTETFVIEDGAIEWLTVVALVASAVLMLARAWRLRGVRSHLFLFVTVMAAAVFLFGAGEEISWGQRLFGVETPEWLAERNKQSEMNLHNLVIGGHSINKLVFSKGLGIVLLIYLIIIPLIYRKNATRAAQLDRMGVPMPRSWHVIVWIAVIVLTEVAVATSKRGELREVLLTMVLFVQLLRPLNASIYDPARNLLPTKEKNF